MVISLRLQNSESNQLYTHAHADSVYQALKPRIGATMVGTTMCLKVNDFTGQSKTVQLLHCTVIIDLVCDTMELCYKSAVESNSCTFKR